MVLADPAVYLELVVSQSGNSTSASKTVASRLGTPCVAAPDPAACQKAITDVPVPTTRSAWSTQSCGGAGCTTTDRYFVSEKAGVVTVVRTAAELRALVAPVDNAAEAALLAVYSIKIDGMDCSAPQVRPLGGGAFEVFLASGDGQCTDRNEQRVRVASDGTTSVVESTTAAAAKQCLYP